MYRKTFNQATENLQARKNQCAKKAGQYAIDALRKEVGSAIRLDDSCAEKENAWFWIGKMDAFDEAVTIVNGIRLPVNGRG